MCKVEKVVKEIIYDTYGNILTDTNPQKVPGDANAIHKNKVLGVGVSPPMIRLSTSNQSSSEHQRWNRWTPEWSDGGWRWLR